MSDEYVFGDFSGGADVDDAIINLIKYWQLSYLSEVARRAGAQADEYKPFRSFRVSHELEWMPEDQTPGLILVNGGLSDTPLKQGTKRPGQTYYATWNYQVGVLLSARGRKDRSIPRAQRIAKQYCLAMRLLLIQKRDDPAESPDFKGVLGMMDWVDEGYDGVDADSDRTLCLAHTDFAVTVPTAATWATGPLQPETVPEPESERWPAVTETDAEVTKEPT